MQYLLLLLFISCSTQKVVHYQIPKEEYESRFPHPIFKKSSKDFTLYNQLNVAIADKNSFIPIPLTSLDVKKSDVRQLPGKQNFEVLYQNKAFGVECRNVMETGTQYQKKSQKINEAADMLSSVSYIECKKDQVVFVSQYATCYLPKEEKPELLVRYPSFDGGDFTVYRDNKDQSTSYLMFKYSCYYLRH